MAVGLGEDIILPQQRGGLIGLLQSGGMIALGEADTGEVIVVSFLVWRIFCDAFVQCFFRAVIHAVRRQRHFGHAAAGNPKIRVFRKCFFIMIGRFGKFLFHLVIAP